MIGWLIVCYTQRPFLCFIFLVRARFYHFYGQPGARLEADMSVYIQQGDCRDESHIFHLLDLLLFFALTTHVQELKSIWVDDIVNLAQWSKFSSRLQAEWSGFTIFVSFFDHFVTLFLKSSLVYSDVGCRCQLASCPSCGQSRCELSVSGCGGHIHLTIMCHWLFDFLSSAFKTNWFNRHFS